MERPAYKLNGKSRILERIYINKEALIYSGCGAKDSHFQICDSICATSDNEVYIINQTKLIKVRFTDEEIFTQETIIDIADKFARLYCATAKHGYLAVSGEDELFVFDLATNEDLAKKLKDGDRVFSEMNNCVDISVHCNEIRLLVADNSGVISIFRLPSMERVAELKHEDAINNAKFSPNGRALCAVGDSNKIYLYSIDDGTPLSDEAFFKLNNRNPGHREDDEALRGQYSLDKTLTLTQSGYGDPQYCAWSADGSYILVSHEADSSFMLNGKTLDTIHMFDFLQSLATATSPVSSLGVYCSRDRLLIFDMLDSVKSTNQQSIFVAHFRYGSVSGITFSPSGKKFFLVTPTGLYIMNTVNIESLKTICIKSLGTDNLRQSVEKGLAPEELYIEPYKPQKKSKNNQGDQDKEKEALPEVFRVKLCASIAEIREIYFEYHRNEDFDGPDMDMSYEDQEDDDDSYVEADVSDEDNDADMNVD